MDKDFRKILIGKLAFENGISISTKKYNDFVDTIHITANKTNESLTVHLDYVEKIIYFWNDCDEKFSQPIDEQGIDFIVNKIKNEFEQTYYFQIVSHPQKMCFITKLETVDIETVKNEAIELKQNSNENFDCLKVFNFIGSKHYIVKLNENGALCEED